MWILFARGSFTVLQGAYRRENVIFLLADNIEIAAVYLSILSNFRFSSAQMVAKFRNPECR